jgi:hypothetical protein
LKRLADVLGLEIGVLAKDLLDRHPVRNQLTICATVIRMPRMQARPPIRSGSNVIRSSTAVSRVTRPRFGAKRRRGGRLILSGGVDGT